MGNIGISYNSAGIPTLSSADQHALTQLEMQGTGGAQLNDAMKLLQAVVPDAYQSAAATGNNSLGQNVNLNLATAQGSTVSVSLPNPGHFFDGLLTMNGQTLTPQAFFNQAAPMMTSFVQKLSEGSTGSNPLGSALTSGAFSAQAYGLQSVSPNNTSSTLSSAQTSAAPTANGTPAPVSATPSAVAPAAVATVDGAPDPSAGLIAAAMDPAQASTLSPAQKAIYDKLQPTEQATMMLQKQEAWRNGMIQLMSQLLKMRHDALMSIISNIRQ